MRCIQHGQMRRLYDGYRDGTGKFICYKTKQCKTQIQCVKAGEIKWEESEEAAEKLTEAEQHLSPEERSTGQELSAPRPPNLRVPMLAMGSGGNMELSSAVSAKEEFKDRLVQLAFEAQRKNNKNTGGSKTPRPTLCGRSSRG